MTAITQEVEIAYKGKTYTCSGNFKFVNRVEQRVNLVMYGRLTEAGTPRISDTAWIIYSALSLAGCTDSYDEVGDDLIKSDGLYANEASALITACFPPSEDDEKAEKKTSRK